jgi:hypothetical protein
MEILEDLFKTIPGLPFVFALAALLLLKNDSEIAEAIRVFVVAWCLYQASRLLDYLFDFFYAPKPKPDGAGMFHWFIQLWWRLRWPVRWLFGLQTLQSKREQAVSRLHLDGTEGLYAKAKEKVETSKGWKTEVYPLIGLSKTARTFILPSFLIAMGTKMSTGEQELQQRIAGSPLLAGFTEDFACAHERLAFLSNSKQFSLAFAHRPDLPVPIHLPTPASHG